MTNPIGASVELTGFVPEDPYGKSAGTIRRGLEILELFAVEQAALTVGQIAEKLNYPQSSTSVLLHNLTELGYLVNDRYARTFFPTVRVTFLGMWLQQRILNQGSLLEFMECLAAESGQLCLLAMQNGTHAQYIHIVSTRASRVGLKPGLLRPLCRSATGKILLSQKSDDEIRRIVRNANTAESALAPPIDAQTLLAELRECRRSGYAFTRDSVTLGSSVVASCLPIKVGGVSVSVGVGINSHEFDKLRPVVMDLLREKLEAYFPVSRDAMPVRTLRPAVVQSEYAVGERSPDA